MRTYSLYLSTTTTAGNPYAPTNKTSLANVSWNINWREIFGDYQGEATVRCKLVSAAGTFTADTLSTYSVSVRGSFTSPYSNNANGVNLSNALPVIDPTISSKVYLFADSTSNAAGVTIKAPTSNQNLNISLFKADGTLASNALEYQLWLYFDVYDLKD
jgi:hypothetical protein